MPRCTPGLAHRIRGVRTGYCGGASPGFGSFFIELADQRQREVCAHVLEVRAHAQVNPIPAWFSVDIADDDASCAQWAASTHLCTGVLLIGHVLANPLVEFQLQVRAFFPRTQLLALQNLEVVSQAID